MMIMETGGSAFLGRSFDFDNGRVTSYGKARFVVSFLVIIVKFNGFGNGGCNIIIRCNLSE